MRRILLGLQVNDLRSAECLCGEYLGVAVSHISNSAIHAAVILSDPDGKKFELGVN